MNCQNFHTMRLIMQLLCRPILTLLCLGWWMTQTTAFAQAPARAVVPPGTAMVTQESRPQASGLQALDTQVRQWLAGQQQLQPQDIRLLPMDSRLRVQDCRQPLQLDLPFAGNAETVRVRCAQPQWQLFVRVALPETAQRTVQPGTAPAPATAAAAAPAPVRQVLVASVPLQRGQRIDPAQLRLQPVEEAQWRSVMLEDPQQALHAEATRDIPAGTPLKNSDVRPILLVKRGQMVQLQVGAGQGFQIVARVEAQQDGRMGEQIRMVNRESGRVLTGQVVGENRVKGL